MSLALAPTRLDDPVALALVEALQADITRRYGGPDPVAADPAEFTPPRGLFLVARLDGRPVGCGGVKDVDAAARAAGRVAEVKRMYVDPGARGRGVARAVLAALEEFARAAGAPRIRLVTGESQPEAVALYRSAGWEPGAPYGPVLEHGWTEALVFERRLRAGAVAGPAPVGAP